MDEHTDGIAKQQLDQLSRRLHTEFADDPAWDGSRALVLSAIKSSNGSQNKVVDMAETQGQLVHFLIQEKLRAPEPITPEQLKKVLLDAHDDACPMASLLMRDEGGKKRLDPVKLKALLPPEAPAAEVSEIAVGLPGGPKLFSFKGKAANALLKYAVYAAIIYGALAWFNAKNKEQRAESLREMANMAAEAYTNALLQAHN